MATAADNRGRLRRMRVGRRIMLVRLRRRKWWLPINIMRMTRVENRDSGIGETSFNGVTELMDGIDKVRGTDALSYDGVTYNHVCGYKRRSFKRFNTGSRICVMRVRSLEWYTNRASIFP